MTMVEKLKNKPSSSTNYTNNSYHNKLSLKEKEFHKSLSGLTCLSDRSKISNRISTDLNSNRNTNIETDYTNKYYMKREISTINTDNELRDKIILFTEGNLQGNKQKNFEKKLQSLKSCRINKDNSRLGERNSYITYGSRYYNNNFNKVYKGCIELQKPMLRTNYFKQDTSKRLFGENFNPSKSCCYGIDRMSTAIGNYFVESTSKNKSSTDNIDKTVDKLNESVFKANHDNANIKNLKTINRTRSMNTKSFNSNSCFSSTMNNFNSKASVNLNTNKEYCSLKDVVFNQSYSKENMNCGLKKIKGYKLTKQPFEKEIEIRDIKDNEFGNKIFNVSFIL